jgi:hypothetical protein
MILTQAFLGHFYWRAASTARTRHLAGCKYSPHPSSGGLQVQPAPIHHMLKKNAREMPENTVK